jgi:sugar lactone lactonase YvrE
MPAIFNQPTCQALWVGGNVTLSAGVSNAGAFTFQWQFNATNLPNGIISTVAGGDVTDGVVATNASLHSPEGTAVDSAGNLLIADASGNRIRKVSTAGIITTVAGNGAYGYSGDGGAATNASLAGPASMVFDASGNLFIADLGNNVVRELDTNGIITTVAGNSIWNYAGDGGPATNASLAFPAGVAFDAAGDLLIADEFNNRIRKVDAKGIITTIAGSGPTGYTGGFSGDGEAATNAVLHCPTSVTVDASGNLFVADQVNNRIRKVGTNGVIVTVAGSGPTGYVGQYSGDGGFATNASLYQPIDVEVDAFGNLLIADSRNQRVRKVDANGIITTIAGNGVMAYSGDGGAATNASLNDPLGLVISASGALFIADCGNNCIRELNTNDVISTIAGDGANCLGNGGAAKEASLYFPFSVVADTSGNLFFADGNNFAVHKVDTNGVITTVAGNGQSGFSGDGGAATNASLQYAGLALDGFGNLFIADGGNNRVRKVDTNGIITTVAGDGTPGYTGDGGTATNATLMGPAGVALDTYGNLFIADGNNCIRKVDTNGFIVTVAGNGTPGYSGDGGAATNAELSAPTGLAVDACGNLFIGDQINNRIRKVDINGIITTVAGNGTPGYSGDDGAATNASLNQPTDVAVDAIGNLYISDPLNHRIREVGTNGIITTVAGNGTMGYSGDDGVATNASLSDPDGVAIDGFGNLFFADVENNRIRKVTTTQGQSLVLNNVTAENAGHYQVVVTGVGGSVTSSVVNLIVASSPLIYQIAHTSNGGAVLNFVAQPNTTNEVLCASNLSPPVLWQSVSTNLAGLHGTWQFTDTNAAHCQMQFFRSLTR